MAVRAPLLLKLQGDESNIYLAPAMRIQAVTFHENYVKLRI